MNNMTPMFTSLLLLVTVIASAAPPEGEGWTKLSNGKDLAGWKVPEGDGGHWKIVDDVIDYDARSEAKGDKNLWSEKSYGDFVLHIDWRIKETHGKYAMKVILPDGSYKKDDAGKDIINPTPNADSGIFLRGQAKSQVNIWCWPVGSGEVWGYRNDKAQPAETRAAVTPNVKADNPVGEWNTFVITMRGDVLNVELNGKHVVEDARLVGIPKAGPLALQHHGGFNEKTGEYNSASSLVQFRNIYIKELTP